MIVNYFFDCLAYTFESGDSIFTLGMKIVNNSENGIISAITVTHNDRVRLLYGIEEYRPLSEMAAGLDKSELINAFVGFVRSVSQIENSDFIKITAIDVNFNRLFYDVKNKQIKFVVLPVSNECDLHDGCSWSKNFRNSILVLMNYIFADFPEKYVEAYYNVMDNSKTDYEIIDYVMGFDYSLERGKKFNPMENDKQKKVMVLVSNVGKNKYNIRVNKPVFTIGKAQTADGTIDKSTTVSRNHCEIVSKDDDFFVKDLDSTNGTSVNGHKLIPFELYNLNAGDRLLIADIEFIVGIE